MNVSRRSEPSGLVHRAGGDLRRADQDRTLEAIHRLEGALGSAAPGRESDWLHDVSAALTTLGQAMSEEQRNADAVDSLLSDIARTQPRLRNRVRGLRAQYREVRDAIEALRGELAGGTEERSADFADVRQRLAWLLTTLRYQRSRESDLLYEAYYDAFHVDVETDTDR